MSVLDPQAEVSHWNTLAGADAAAAWKAIQTLSIAPEAAVAVGKRVRPVQPVSPDRLQSLLAGLRSNRFSVREKAAEELEKLGELAEPSLREVLGGQPPLELRQRIEKLLERLATTPLSSEQIRVGRVLEMLEQTASRETRQLLQDLSQGAPAHGRRGMPSRLSYVWPLEDPRCSSISPRPGCTLRRRGPSS